MLEVRILSLLDQRRQRLGQLHPRAQQGPELPRQHRDLSLHDDLAVVK